VERPLDERAGNTDVHGGDEADPKGMIGLAAV
jgi:hypothetical protein